MEPPPQAKQSRGEHHGLWLGIMLGLLTGLLLGAVVLLAIQLGRGDVVEDVRNDLRTDGESGETVPTPEETTANTMLIDRPEVMPGEQQESESSSMVEGSRTGLSSGPTIKDQPGVVTTSPLQADSEVANDTEISISFTTAMDESTLDPTTVLVYQNGKNIGGTLEYHYSSGRRELVIGLAPGDRYTAGALIQVQVTTQVASAAGVPLGQGEVLEFTIAS